MRGARRRGGLAHAALALLAAALAARAASAASPGALAGRVVLGVEGVSVRDVGPVVVYLDAVEGRLAYEKPRAVAKVTQRDARFQPPFLVVVAGQTIVMPNDDAIYHNVFSYSKPNDFDLGLYPAGELRQIVFHEPGVVKTYCSIHESMNGTIFVAPSPWWAVANRDGAWSIPGVPPGRYRLRAWSEKLPGASELVEVAPGARLEVELAIGPGAGPHGLAAAP